MSEVMKDSAIKLFGRTISLPHNRKVSANDSSSDHSPPSSSSSPGELSSATKHEAERIEEPSKKELITSTQDKNLSHQSTEDSKSPTSSTIFENPKTPSSERETSLLKSSKNGEQSETSESQDNKGLKKPDKILPCPRCNSMDTKFCYYNNYNVNQPRHFCKNCQRYWTAGGTMRNVPVGAGRRKNKNISSSCSSAAASHYRQMMMMVPETLQANEEAVLTFGSDSSPLCNSMASGLSLADKTQPKALFHAPKQSIFVREDSNGDDRTSSEKRGNFGSYEESIDKNCQVFPPQFPFQGSSSIPWPYPWNPAMPSPAFCQLNYPVPFYHAPAFWAHPHPISPQSSANSPALGKHSREGEILFPSNSEKEKSSSRSNGVLIPKTLRIDDPNEASKSSIWSTLGIKHDEKGNSLNGGGSLFKGFDKKSHVAEASPLLHANPAALSRSRIFHERT